MGWKTINGHRYYYKSERGAGRVKTTYFGAGESGLLVWLLELEDRAEREAELEKKRAEREEYDTEDRAVSSWFDDVQAVLTQGWLRPSPESA